MSKDLSDEIARTISETQDGFKEIVQPIMERVTRLSTEESRTAAAVVKVSEDVAKIKMWISTIDEKVGMLVEGGSRKYRGGLKGSEWARPWTVRSVVDLVVDLVDLIATLTGENKAWSDRAVEFVAEELRKEVRECPSVVLRNANYSFRTQFGGLSSF